MTTQAQRTPEVQFAACGQDVLVWPLAKIINPEVIFVGDSVIIDDFVLIMGGTQTRIGSFVHIASFVSLLGGGDLTIQDFAGISSGARIYTGTDDFLGGSLTGPTIPSSFRKPLRSFVNIGRHALVGANTVILPGVTIEEGAAIGAGSVVTKNCNAWTVYAGAPCRAVKPRPKDRMLDLERQLKATVYTSDGNYIPRSARS